MFDKTMLNFFFFQHTVRKQSVFFKMRIQGWGLGAFFERRLKIDVITGMRYMALLVKNLHS